MVLTAHKSGMVRRHVKLQLLRLASKHMLPDLDIG